METYKHKSGLTETVDGWSVFWSFLFGWMYYLVKGSVKHAVLYIVLALTTLSISCFIYPFFTRNILHKKYLLSGYKLSKGK